MNEQSGRIVGILLAAGAGRRFGGDKLLGRLAGGRTLGAQASAHMVQALGDVVAVVKPGDERLAAEIAATGARIVVCPEAAQGMGTSLACGVRAAADAGGWVVALADMPLIRPATIVAVAQALRAGAALAAAGYQGKRGHPVGFAREFGDGLAALSGDAGARDILRAHADRLRLLECDDPGVLADIDTPEDLVRYRGRDD